MRRMNLLKRVRREDKGVSLVFAAVIMTSLVGMAGFAIDAGKFYQERKELRNGADAAVLAVAEDCAHGVVPCTLGQGTATADSYADANATDDAAAIDSITINVTQQSVRVVTMTENADGSNILRPFFMQVVGFNGSTVRGYATATWDYPSALGTLPLIISDCEYPGPPPYSGDPVTIYFHSGGNENPCNAQAGHDVDGDGFLPGGFGWLETIDNTTCEAELIVAVFTNADPGSSPSNGCEPEDLEAMVGTDIAIPYFNDVDGITGQGSGGMYEVAGFGMFHVLGYNFGGQYKAPSKGSPPCSGSDRCIRGYWTTGSTDDGTGGGDYRGIAIVKLTE